MSAYQGMRWFAGRTDEELNDTLENAELVPAIRAYRELCRRHKIEIPHNALYLLTEAEHKIEEMINER